MTVAERVAEQMGNDGQLYVAAPGPNEGRSLDSVCRMQTVTVTTADYDGSAHPGGPSPDALRYLFSDGSAIVDLGTGWDIEGSEPWTWTSVEERG